MLGNYHAFRTYYHGNDLLQHLLQEQAKYARFYHNSHEGIHDDYIYKSDVALRDYSSIGES